MTSRGPVAVVGRSEKGLKPGVSGVAASARADIAGSPLGVLPSVGTSAVHAARARRRLSADSARRLFGNLSSAQLLTADAKALSNSSSVGAAVIFLPLMKKVGVAPTPKVSAARERMAVMSSSSF